MTNFLGQIPQFEDIKKLYRCKILGGSITQACPLKVMFQIKKMNL